MMPFTISITLTILLFVALQPATAHVYIKSWKSSLENNFQLAQKQPLHATAYRDASSNIGWIGSRFLSGDRAIVCGASKTPFDQIASPGGTYFSDASQAAGKTLTVQAGGKVTLVTAGDHGKGFPHPNGHIQAYLGYCGESPTACQKFDASSANFFKIQEVKNAVQDKLRAAMNYDLDGNVWEVPIPAQVPQGSYIFRFEIIAFDQSKPSEGQQDQYYPSCGQLYVKSTHRAKSFSNFQTVKFPGAYKNGNIQKSSAPGPHAIQLSTRSASEESEDNATAVKKTNLKLKVATDEDSAPDESSTTTTSEAKEPSKTCVPKLIPSCATRCLNKKIEEAATLAAGCSPSDGKCLCSRTSFVQAYGNCTRDHCSAGTELSAAISALSKQCDRLKTATESRDLSLRRHRRRQAAFSRR